MDPDTIDASTATLENAGTGASVRAAVRCNDPCKKVTLNPSATKLAKKTKYEATIATGAEDLAGNALSRRNVWSFTTGSG